MNQEEQKEKYSAFISDVAEILGLGKPIDILKLCMVTDRFFKPLQNQVKKLEAQIENYKLSEIEAKQIIAELEEQNEKMKCCSNCDNWNWKHSKCEKKLKGNCFKQSKWILRR